MKRNYFLVFAVLMIFMTTASINASAVVSNNSLPSLQERIANGEIETALTKKNLEAELGRKLTLKERVGVNLIQRKIAKNKQEGKVSNSGKNQFIALLLCFFLGYLGIHRFYLGYTGWGIIYLFTAGIFGIGWFIDTILLIIPNGLTPKNGSY